MQRDFKGAARNNSDVKCVMFAFSIHFGGAGEWPRAFETAFAAPLRQTQLRHRDLRRSKKIWQYAKRSDV